MASYHNYERSTVRFGGPLTPAVKKLIIVTVAVFFFQAIAGLSGLSLVGLFGLVPAFVSKKLMIWQLFTYMFLHGGPYHLLFNMLALWMFGGDVEAEWGSKKFLFYYFYTGVGAALLTLIVSPSSYVATIGASGAIYGLLVAFAMLFPNRQILVFFLFPMKAKHFVIIFGVIEFYFTMSYVGDGVARFAHLGGMLFGYIFIKNESALREYWRRLLHQRREMSIRKSIEREMRRQDYIKREIDPILDKISKFGMGSLSRRERRILKKGGPLKRF